MENKIKQLRKGVFELLIVKTLEKQTHYGYSLIRSITNGDQVSINEGTIYPLLSRLAKEELVLTEWVESNQGPPRKYYRLSAKGKDVLARLSEEFTKLTLMVNNINKPSKNEGKKAKPIKVKKEGHHEQ